MVAILSWVNELIENPRSIWYGQTCLVDNACNVKALGDKVLSYDPNIKIFYPSMIVSILISLLSIYITLH